MCWAAVQPDASSSSEPNGTRLHACMPLCGLVTVLHGAPNVCRVKVSPLAPAETQCQATTPARLLRADRSHARRSWHYGAHPDPAHEAKQGWCAVLPTVSRRHASGSSSASPISNCTPRAARGSYVLVRLRQRRAGSSSGGQPAAKPVQGWRANSSKVWAQVRTAGGLQMARPACAA